MQRTEGKEVRTHLTLHLVGVRECQGERGREGARRCRQRMEGRDIRTHLVLHLAGERECQRAEEREGEGY